MTEASTRSEMAAEREIESVKQGDREYKEGGGEAEAEERMTMVRADEGNITRDTKKGMKQKG